MKRRKYNKLLSIIGIITMLIGLLPVTIQAQTPTLTFEFPQPTSNDKNDKWNVGIDRMSNIGIDFATYVKMYIDNKNVRCSQLAIGAITGAQYSVDLLDTKEYPQALITKLQDIEAFGYGMKNDTSNEMDFATSIRIWQELHLFDPVKNANPTHIHPDIQSKIDLINQRLAIKEKNVSFHNETIQLIGYGEQYGIVVSDTQNVFQHYIETKIEGIHYKRNGNTIKIWAERSDNPSGSLSFQLFPTNKTDVSLAYSSIHESQDVIYLSGAKPKTINLHYQVNQGEAELQKQDIETGKTPQGNASLFQNGAYKLYYAKDVIINNRVVHKTDELVSELSISKEHNIHWKNLICADYYIQESVAPIGYLLDSTKHYFSINKDNKKVVVVANEQVKKQGAEIVKISTNGEGSEVNYLEGVEFSGKLLSEVNEKGKDAASVVCKVTTDNKGYAKIPELPYGVYIFYETKTPEGYLSAQPFIIEINEDSREPLPIHVVNNPPFEAYVRGIKQNATTQPITLTSAVFELYDSEGKKVSFKIGNKEITKLKTDEKGVFSTPLKLKSGIYTIQEIETPKGFIKLDVPITVNVSSDTVLYDDSGDAFVEIVIHNEQAEGKLLLNKIFEKKDNAIPENLEAGFEVKVASPIINPSDGSILYKEGAVIKNPNREDGLYVVKQNETLEIEHLPIGVDGSSFIISEKVFPEGYKKMEDFVINFKAEDDNKKIYIINKKIENKVIKTNVKFVKIDEYTKNSIVDKDFEFAMYEDEQCTKFIKSVHADITTGSVVFSNIPYGKTYYFKEVIAPNGYYLSDKIISLTFDKQHSEIGKTIQIEYANTPIPKISTLAKGEKNQKIFDPTKKNTILDITNTEDFDISLTYDRITELINKKDYTVAFSLKDTLSFDEKDRESIIHLVIPANTVKEDGEYYIAQHYYNHSDGKLYLSHNNPSDKNQSITFQTKEQPKTFDSTNIKKFLMLAGLSTFFITSTFHLKRKVITNKRKD